MTIIIRVMITIDRHPQCQLCSTHSCPLSYAPLLLLLLHSIITSQSQRAPPLPYRTAPPASNSCFPAPRPQRYRAPTPRSSHRSSDRCLITTTPLPSEAGTGMQQIKAGCRHVRIAAPLPHSSSISALHKLSN